LDTVNDVVAIGDLSILCVPTHLLMSGPRSLIELCLRPEEDASKKDSHMIERVTDYTII